MTDALPAAPQRANGEPQVFSDENLAKLVNEANRLLERVHNGQIEAAYAADAESLARSCAPALARLQAEPAACPEAVPALLALVAAAMRGGLDVHGVVGPLSAAAAACAALHEDSAAAGLVFQRTRDLLRALDRCRQRDAQAPKAAAAAAAAAAGWAAHGVAALALAMRTRDETMPLRDATDGMAVFRAVAAEQGPRREMLSRAPELAGLCLTLIGAGRTAGSALGRRCPAPAVSLGLAALCDIASDPRTAHCLRGRGAELAMLGVARDVDADQATALACRAARHLLATNGDVALAVACATPSSALLAACAISGDADAAGEVLALVATLCDCGGRAAQTAVVAAGALPSVAQCVRTPATAAAGASSLLRVILRNTAAADAAVDAGCVSALAQGLGGPEQSALLSALCGLLRRPRGMLRAGDASLAPAIVHALRVASAGLIEHSVDRETVDATLDAMAIMCGDFSYHYADAPTDLVPSALPAVAGAAWDAAAALRLENPTPVLCEVMACPNVPWGTVSRAASVLVSLSDGNPKFAASASPLAVPVLSAALARALSARGASAGETRAAVDGAVAAVGAALGVTLHESLGADADEFRSVADEGDLIEQLWSVLREAAATPESLQATLAARGSAIDPGARLPGSPGLPGSSVVKCCRLGHSGSRPPLFAGTRVPATAFDGALCALRHCAVLDDVSHHAIEAGAATSCVSLTTWALQLELGPAHPGCRLLHACRTGNLLRLSAHLARMVPPPARPSLFAPILRSMIRAEQAGAEAIPGHIEDVAESALRLRTCLGHHGTADASGACVMM